MKGLFDKYYEKYDSWYDNNKFAYLSEIKALMKVVPAQGKGLEVGVGTGRFASVLGIENGIDPSLKMINIARKRGIKASLGLGEKVPFQPQVFDYIAIVITLCFVKDPGKVIGEAMRLLKRRGKLIVGIVDKESFLGKYYKSKKSVFYKNARFFSVEGIVNLMKKAGFGKFAYYQTLFKLPEMMKRAENPRKGFGRGGFVVISAEK
ncbi:MAG: class I SAM-dependent methyltransferase [Candidatus Omnitrophota bacterium]|jgi:ubiquinone/menaquinone biosynthesis C-methylase UbiE